MAFHYSRYWDVHRKVRVEVISCRDTVLILFAQCNGVEDSVKDFSVASEVTSGIDHGVRIQCPFALSLHTMLLTVLQFSSTNC